MRAVRSLAWVAVLLVGALAIAGLVVSLDHPPSGDARPELTGRDAAILAPRLAALQPTLGTMATEAEAVAAAGRGALTTEIMPAPAFYFAEEDHQQYLAKNPWGYCGLAGTGVTCPLPAEKATMTAA